MCVGAKLTQSQEVKVVDIGAKAGGNHLLEQLPTALEEGDRPVGLCSSIIRLVGLRDDNDGRGGPGVNAHLQGASKDQREVVRSCSEAPFEEEVGDAGRAGSGFIRRASEGGGDLSAGDLVEGPGREMWQVREEREV